MSKLNRREFIKLAGAGSIGIGTGFMLAESIKHPVEHLIPAVVAPEDYSPGVATWYNTICNLCPAGCGISVRTREGRAKKIEGNPAHPVNQGRLCALGQAGLQVLYNPDRLTEPMLRDSKLSALSAATVHTGHANWIPASWQNGLDKVTNQLQHLLAKGQGDQIAFLSTGVRGHLANLFELFMAQLGSERLIYFDFAHPHTLYKANKKLFGEQLLPYYDIKNSRYLLSFGADYLTNWLSPVHHSLGYGHSRQGHPDGRGYFVQIEPRMSLSGASADEWIAAKPGSEGQLALGLAHQIVNSGHYKGTDVDSWTKALQDYTSDKVANLTGVSADTIRTLADNFANSEASLAIGGGAANHTNGVDNLIAINLLNYLVGNLGKTGGIIFNSAPVVGQPSNSHQASLQQMTQLAAEARQGKIQVLVVNDCNPVFNLPATVEFKQAMAEIPLVVSLSSFMDETTAMADIILPSHSYLESWGDDFPEPGVGFPIGSISQPVVSPLYNTKATGDTILALAAKLNFDQAMPWENMQDYLKHGWRHLYTQSSKGIEGKSFESFWQEVLQAGVWGQKTHREQQSVSFDKSLINRLDVAMPEFSGDSEHFPFILHPYLSVALQDGRGANLPWMQELPDPITSVVYGSWVELNPTTAKRLGFSEGDLVDVESAHGKLRVPVFIYPAIRPDVIAIPIGQGHQYYGRYAQNRGVNPIQILSPQVDQSTGSLAWHATRVRLLATGKQVSLVKTGATSRQLGREIIQTSSSQSGMQEAVGKDAAALTSIPIREL